MVYKEIKKIKYYIWSYLRIRLYILSTDEKNTEKKPTSLRRDKNPEFQSLPENFGLKATPEFKAHVAKKLSDVIEK